MVILLFIVGLLYFVIHHMPSFQKIIDSADPEVMQTVIAQADILSLDPKLAQAICLKESSGQRIDEIGLNGEVGVMQVTPVAQEQIGIPLSLDSDLADQAYAGCLYLDWLIGHGKGLDWTIRAYNAGPHGADLGRSASYARQVMDFYNLIK